MIPVTKKLQRIMNIDWAGTAESTGFWLKRESYLTLQLTKPCPLDVDTLKRIGMQPLHKNEREWKLFDFLKDVVDPTGINYAFLKCNILRKIPSLSKRKEKKNVAKAN